MTERELHELAGKQAALGEVRGTPAPDPVNVPMIRRWLDAMGDANPAYLDKGVAPPAMAQVWTMPGLRPAARDRSPVDDVLNALDAAGYTGVVATNCEQTYHRYARVGERLTPATRFSDLAGPKRTALGTGYFATWNVTWYADDEPVTEMLFRILKFRPPDAPEQLAPYPLQPAVNQDTAFFWEGVRQGELRIQTCTDCGELRHPPGPLCPRCRSANRSATVASGRGVLYSYVVHHHPQVPGRETPFVVGVVELPEGVRIVGNVVDCPAEEVEIGMPLRVVYRRMDDQLVLPMWAPS
ncbi:bifunctional MaoC family dehydratase/OB-fold nucleic acid binding domain-containing protein [Nonomuraea sp. K274]|uniref:Bifunctional MaoC family dehydratase/OB-fold nucleic acid binding domain-containing protein n=1 Tax=Nonomuraea cypriaca TaxID=1187855 RepID=A0A931A5H9_9ACTN|nr:bifunctional MaoC family dehydratase N-terminal/OB-fold nucleic acid binding domain-containing protein [Nonomuraea cypriaca]MBF8186716.1 bifunctional MaoC family dehydratase/OB-fold nucleic acid binding domain-containing protein [Nonomuraea cypriaca]